MGRWRPWAASMGIGWWVLSLVAARAAAQGVSPPADADALAQADRTLVAALARTDLKTVATLLDEEFIWTTATGETRGKSQVLAALPAPPLGDERDAQVVRRLYGALGAVQVSHGKFHILRVWGRRPAGWRLVVYHEVRQRDAPSTDPPLPTTNECDNPCKRVPYTPQSEAERGILASWQALETAVLNHDPKAWAPHFLDEFVLISSGGTEPVTKAMRIAQLSRPGVGPAPPALAADPPVRFVVFGDAAVMISQSRPYAGKPARVSRVWVLRDGLWRMAASYQTTIQAAPAIVPPGR